MRVAQANPHLGAEYETVKTLFLHPAQAQSFINALNEGGTYRYGRPQTEGRNGPTAGFYAAATTSSFGIRKATGTH